MPGFTAGERKVMRLLWEHGEMKPAEVQARFPGPIKNPALRAYLTALVEKGHVARRKVGRAYHYRAVTGPGDGFREALDDLVDVYCGGSIRALLMNIMRAERLSAGELLDLKRLADAIYEPAPRAEEGRT